MTGLPHEVLSVIDTIEKTERGNVIALRQQDANMLTSLLKSRQTMMLESIHELQFSGLVTLILALVVAIGTRKSGQPAAGDNRHEDKAKFQR